MVTWHEGDSVAGGNAVHARAVSLAGCVGADRIISNTIDANGAVIGGDKTWWEAGPAIAYSTRSQRWLVVWRSIVSVDGQFNDVNGRILDLSGQPLGISPVKVTHSSGYEDNPSVAYNPTTDEFLVTYSGEDGTSPYRRCQARDVRRDRGSGVRALPGERHLHHGHHVRRFDRQLFLGLAPGPGRRDRLVVNGVTGAPEGAPIPLSTRFTANDAMSVAYNALSGTSFLVSHDQLTSEDGGFEISAAGVPGAGFGTTSIGGKGNYYPRIAASSVDKRWMMVTANNFAAIFGQFISSTGGGVPHRPRRRHPRQRRPSAPSREPTGERGTPVGGDRSRGRHVTSAAPARCSISSCGTRRASAGPSRRRTAPATSYTWFPPAGTQRACRSG